MVYHPATILGLKTIVAGRTLCVYVCMYSYFVRKQSLPEISIYVFGGKGGGG